MQKECVYCGCNEDIFLTKDHIVPKSRGGLDTEENKQTCCWFCNQMKGGLTHKEYLEYRKALRILRKLKKIRILFPNRIPINFYQDYIPEVPVQLKPIDNKNEVKDNGN